jgi:hypothetical protein
MQKKKTPTTVTLAILTTLTVFAWIFFDVYRILKKTPVIDIDPKILEMVNPVLDQETLGKIEEGKYYNESTINKISPEPEITPIIEEAPQPATSSATESAEQIEQIQ